MYPKFSIDDNVKQCQYFSKLLRAPTVLSIPCHVPTRVQCIAAVSYTPPTRFRIYIAKGNTKRIYNIIYDVIAAVRTFINTIYSIRLFILTRFQYRGHCV